MRSTQDRRTHADTLTVWWWITLTSCTNAEQPVWAHWSISEHSCYTAQRQHNNTTKTVSLGTQTHSLAHNTYTHAQTHARTHTHSHTHLHTWSRTHRSKQQMKWDYLLGLRRRLPVGAEQEWCLATVQLHNEAQASCQQVLQMSIFMNICIYNYLGWHIR